MSKDRVWAEIHLGNLKRNLEYLKTFVPKPCEIMAVVKANAYGHGVLPVVNYLEDNCQVKWFAVATFAEALELRCHGVTGEILILGFTAPEEFEMLHMLDLTQTVVDEHYARLLDEAGKPVKVHIKVDTGMSRLGESYEHIDSLKEILGRKNLKVTGMFSHLCCADSKKEEDIQFCRVQIQRFQEVVRRLWEDGYSIPRLHLLSSYGIVNCGPLLKDFPESYGYVRPGIMMYGVGSEEIVKELFPVMELKARVASIREIEKGTGISYGLQFVAEHTMRVAAVTIGYADGLSRSMGQGESYVLIKGKQARILGRICMDQLVVDITGINGVETGDTVTVIGKDGEEEIRAEQVALWSNTITNEVFCQIGDRVERVADFD